MVPRKEPKKSEEACESSNPDGYFVFDTTPHAVDSIKSRRQIFDILEYELRNCLDYFGNEKTGNKLRDIEKSELHKIFTQTRVMSYN
jgi:hypothetical protein